MLLSSSVTAKVMSFGQLCSLMSPAAKEGVVLKCVQQVADLVQGCWVVKRYGATLTNTHTFLSWLQ